MISTSDIDRLTGADVYGSDGDRIGTAAQVYLDDQTGEPEWVTVRTGMSDTAETFVPLNRATFSGDRIEVPYDKERVKDAPQIGSDGSLSPAEEDELYAHYGLDASGDQRSDATATSDADVDADTTSGTAAGDGDTVGRDTSGPTTDDAMTRSEERLVAGTRTEQVGRARLRKYVVTEQQQVTVPVSREEVRLEREPITDANYDKAVAGPEISEAEYEVTLTAERPVVETETVPVERVRLSKETVTDTETVSGEVRKEQIELDDETGTLRDSDRS
jgi:uncharacterized protein (TIGR02271 family)